MKLFTWPGPAWHARSRDRPDGPMLDVWYPAPALVAEPIAVPRLEALRQDPIRGVGTCVVGRSPT